MDLNINISFTKDKEITNVIKLLTKIGIQMASIQEIVEASRAEQDLIAAALITINGLIAEVKQLLTMGNITGAQELLDKIAINSEALVKVSLEGADVAAAVDAANGDPAVVNL